MDIIPYAKHDITDDDIAAVTASLRSGWLTQGPAIQQFEQACAEFLDSPYAVAVNSGTAALHLAFLAVDVGPGDKILSPSISFAATTNAALYCGAEAEFVDLDLSTYGIDLVELEKKLRAAPGRYKAVVAVDYGGFPLDWPQMRALADKYKVALVADACHAFGAKFKGKDGTWYKCGDGRFADVSCFSFHPAKHLCTGEGGLITTRDKDKFEQMKLLRSHGITKDPALMKRTHGPWGQEMQTLGFNYRIPDVLCALGLSQLSRMDDNLKRRREVAESYTTAFRDLPMGLPKQDSSVLHAYHLYVVQTEDRAKLYDHLKADGIYAQVHYPPIHHHPYYQQRYGELSLPNSDEFYRRALSIPMYHSMTQTQTDRVIKSVRSFFSR